MVMPGFSDPTPGEHQEAPQTVKRTGKIREAMAWLQGAMATGARPAAEVEAEALAAGIAHSTLAEARSRLHIASKKLGHQWMWVPPKARKKQPVTA